MLPAVSRGSFFDDSTRQRTTQAIRGIEARTSAEVVVAVSPRASHYVETTLLVAASAALVAFVVMWWSPVVYDVRTIPLDVALTFVVVALCLQIADLPKRLLTPRRVQEARVRREAERAFARLGIEKTQDRTGMLVFVSLLEGEVRMLCDRGIRRDPNGEAFEGIEEELRAAVRARDVDGFLSSFARLGEPLEQQLPRQEGDVNELSDDVA